MEIWRIPLSVKTPCSEGASRVNLNAIGPSGSGQPLILRGPSQVMFSHIPGQHCQCGMKPRSQPPRPKSGGHGLEDQFRSKPPGSCDPNFGLFYWATPPRPNNPGCSLALRQPHNLFREVGCQQRIAKPGDLSGTSGLHIRHRAP